MVLTSKGFVCVFIVRIWKEGRARKDVEMLIKLMPVLENSPVLCAYGLQRYGCLSRLGGTPFEIQAGPPPTTGFHIYITC